jgi:hypothetical protein
LQFFAGEGNWVDLPNSQIMANQGKYELCIILYGTMVLLMRQTTIQFCFFKPQSTLNIGLKGLAEKDVTERKI